MLAKSSFLFTTILSFILMLLTSPLFASALPIPIAAPAPAPLAVPQVPTSLLGRTIILRSAAAEAVDADADTIPNRAERFALRMKHARKPA